MPAVGAELPTPVQGNYAGSCPDPVIPD